VKFSLRSQNFKNLLAGSWFWVLHLLNAARQK
jgi:hypothetical protein